jgi:cyanophycin synthetase
MGDHLGLNYITTVEDLAVVKKVVVQNVAVNGMAVLNAADPMTVSMAAVCPGAVTLFAQNGQLPAIAMHRAHGHRVVYVEGAQIIAAQHHDEHRIDLAKIPLTRNGTIGFQVENAMAAIAAAWALNVEWSVILKGVSSFVNDAQNAPGRFNFFEYRGASVIADYGHNPDAIIALVSAIENIPAKKRMVVISGAGDRRDIDISHQSAILGDAFDEVILYEDQCQRGREDGEVLALLRSGLANASRTKKVDEIRGEFLAIDTALSRLEKDDLCLILIDQVDEALAYISQRISQT